MDAYEIRANYLSGKYDRPDGTFDNEALIRDVYAGLDKTIDRAYPDDTIHIREDGTGHVGANVGPGPHNISVFRPEAGPVADAAAWAEATMGGYRALQDAGRQAYLAERRQKSEGQRAFNVWSRLSPVGKEEFRKLQFQWFTTTSLAEDVVDAEIIEDGNND